MVVTPRLLSRLQVGFIRKMPAGLEQPEGPAPCSTAAGHRLVYLKQLYENMFHEMEVGHRLLFDHIHILGIHIQKPHFLRLSLRECAKCASHSPAVINRVSARACEIHL